MPASSSRRRDGDDPTDPTDARAIAEERPAWAWIDRAALRHNARRAIDEASGRVVIGVVKADGYGHGAEVVARALLAEGVARLAVVSVAEGAALRRAGIVAPILLLGGLVDAAGAKRAIKWGLTPVLHGPADFELARSFGRPDAPLAVELEIDTGMSRMGVAPADAGVLLARILDSRQLTPSGVFSHYARADEPDAAPSQAQCKTLAGILEGALAPGESRPVVHVANSAGLLRRAELEEGRLETTGVRPGLMLYGLTPFDDRAAETLDLEPAMTLAARVVAIRRIEAGDPVGYGGEWTAPRATTIATLPLGYADGIPRSVVGKGMVHLAGAMRPIVGRVSMDSICIDVGDAPIALGDVATVFGRTPEGERIPVEALARAAGTIGYEIVVGIGARVRRIEASGPPLADPMREAGLLD